MDFTARKSLNFHKNPPHKIVAGWRRLFLWANLFFLTSIVTPSRAQIGQLQNVKITLNDSTAGADAIYQLAFEPTNGLAKDGKIVIYFPKSFNISNVFVAAGIYSSDDPVKLDGGLSAKQGFETDFNVVTLERDGTGTDIDSGVEETVKLKMAIMGNPPTPGTYKTIRVLTQQGGRDIDERNDVVVTITPGPLDHFSFSNIGSQIVDSLFSFTILAKDAYNNDRPLSNVSVTLSDNTVTLTPAGVTMSGTSFTVSNAKITKAQSGVKITATANNGTVVSTSNAFGVNQLKILSIDTAPDKVSSKQRDIEVNMLVQNVGPDTVNLKNTQLSFSRTNPGDNNSSYTVNPPLPLPKIPGASLKTLKFLVTVNAGASPGGVAINGSVSGTISSQTVRDTDADVKDSWTVQSAPTVIYVNNPNPGLIPNQVSIGSSYEFQAAVQNNGQATFELNPDSTTLTFNNGANTFSTKLDANRGVSLLGGRKDTLSFRSILIQPKLPLLDYASTLKLIGKHNDVRSEQTLSLSALKINPAPQLQIENILSTQDIVTQGMRKPWTITLAVKNNSTSPVDLRSTELWLVKLGTGGGRDDSYTIVTPDTFKVGKKRLGAKQTGELEFTIIQTGNQTGILGVFAKVYVDQLPQTPAESNGMQKSILVQTPAKLSVTLQTSQAKVTHGQTEPWQVILRAKNAGESAVQLIFDGDLDAVTRTSLINQNQFIVTRLTTNDVLAGFDSTDIVFEVTKTNPSIIVPGDLEISGQVFAKELNSAASRSAATTGKITVQTQAHVRIKSVDLFEMINSSSVNTLQKFSIKVQVEQTANTEQVDTVWVDLAKSGSNNNATISKTPLSLAGDLSSPLFFEVTAGSIAGVQATFNANITKARSVNTKNYTVAIDPNPNNGVSVNVQAPAQLSVNTPTISDTSVHFGSTQPAWKIECIVSNKANPTSGSAIVVDSSKVTVKINNRPQFDYDIRNLKTPAVLSAGQKDTLKYQVVQTGYTGGQATLTVTAYGHDKNTNVPISANGSKNFTVESSALVKILRTDFAVNVNRVAGSEIGLVNIAQNFKIEVTVENTGLEVIDTAYVSLQKSGNSTVSPLPAKAVAIATNGGTAKAIFDVTAASSVNAIGETFMARLGRVVTKGGAPAARGANGDTTAVAHIELPARLQLSLMTADGATTFGFNQRFKIRARVKNLGEAQTDKSGELQLSFSNNDYKFVGNEPPKKNFAAGDSAEWNIQAPFKKSLQDVFTVKITNRPVDKNSGSRADTVNTMARLTVNTLTDTLGIAAKSIVDPAGARDRIVSTNQFFTVRVQLKASSNLTNKTVKLTLPKGSGYRLVNGDGETQPAPSDTARWQVQAPSIENLRPVKLPFDLNAFNGQTPVSSSDTLVILGTEQQAILQLEPGLEETGASSGAVSSKQSFKIVLKVRNTGRAGVTDTAVVTLNLPPAPTIAVQSPLKQKFVLAPGTAVQKIIWQATAPKQPQQDALTFAMTQKPRDENTGFEVLTSNDPAPFTVITVAGGTVSADSSRITDPPGAGDRVLSTGQEFVVSDTLRWTNATNLVAELMLPPNFTALNTRIQNIPNLAETGKTEISWVVRAPVGAVASTAFRVSIKAKDSHDATVALADTSEALQVNVVRRAELFLRAKITEPASAMDGVLSIRQPFTIVATLDNAGTANLDSTAEVVLQLPADKDYQLVGSAEDSLRRITFPGQNTCSWRVQARSSITTGTDLIKVWLKKPPHDQNTNTSAAINDAETALAVRTEGRKLIVAPADQGGGPTVQGRKNFLLMRLKFINPAGSNLLLTTLGFKLRQRDGNPVSPGAGALLKNVYLVNGRGDELGSIKDISANSQSVQISLDSLQIMPDKPDTVSILADLADNAAGTFRLLFDDGKNFVAVDQEGGFGVAIESADGKQGPQFRLESDPIVLLGANDENSFFNYPNPFPPGNDRSNGEGTRFSVPLGASGELKIVTLLGESVWGTTLDARNATDAAIFWNGHNGAGKRVLNGVYLAILRTKDGKTLTTKVAVLKK